MKTTDLSVSDSVHPGCVRAAEADRRRCERHPFHTVVTVLSAEAREFELHRCWLGDISATGARLFSRKSLGCGELYLQILMDGLQGRFVVAEITNERVVESDRIGERRSHQYVYGVQFKAFVSSADVLEKLELVFPTSNSSVRRAITDTAP